MLLTDARRPARTGADGELIPLTEQIEPCGMGNAIAEGIALSPRPSEGFDWCVSVQAAIAAVHDEAARVEDTTGRRSSRCMGAHAHVSHPM